MAAGNLRVKTDSLKGIPGYKTMKVDLVDLEKLVSDRHEKQSSEKRLIC